jgi:hypothetical protein
MKVLEQHTHKILCKLSGYYTQGQLYRFVYGEQGQGPELQPAEQKFKPQIVILGRDQYQEQLLSYPIDNNTALAKLLKLQYSQPDSRYLVVSRAEGHSQVNLWQYQANLPSARVFIPETYLLSQTLERNQILVQDPVHEQGKTLFVASQHKGCVSALKNTLVSGPLLFSAALGINVQHTLYSKDTECAGRLITGLMACPTLQLGTFITLTKGSAQGVSFKTLGLPVVVLLSLYLSLTSAWLGWQQQSLRAQVAAEKSQLRQALSLQDDFNRQQDKLAKLEAFFHQQQSRSLVLLTLAGVIEDAQIDVLRFDDGRFIILGKTNPVPRDSEAEANIAEIADSNEDQPAEKPIYRATEFLEKLISLPNVTDARFDAAVRRSNNYENFTVSFVLNPVTAMADQFTIDGSVNTKGELR